MLTTTMLKENKEKEPKGAFSIEPTVYRGISV